MKRCDIIIPIYNAYDCIKPCIDSVINNTNMKENSIIIIEDKSSDNRVKPLLKEYEKKYKFISVIYNKENLGFVKSVNKGMKKSKNDVLLLNSDTEVTQNWLEKIKKCASSGEKIATVTPLSNNATLASVPNCFIPNNLPKGLTLEQMGILVESCSKKEYPEIPTGHGFCLFIKRDALDEIGLFDEKSFGRGYGEENDFCFRALDKGYRHLLCDDTYIYHKESQSFTHEKKELIKEGLKVLQKKYPKYKERLDLWCSKKQIKYITDNIIINLEANKKRPNILYIIHDWKDIENNLGGTTLHAYDLIKEMRKYYNFHVLSPEDGMYKLYSYWEEYENVVIYPEVTEFHLVNYYNKDYKNMINNIIENYGISLIHIHHLIGNYFDLTDIIKSKKIYTILTLHDYYSACPLINKIYKNKKYCNNPTKNKCNECLQYVMNSEINIESWHKEWIKLFNVVDKIITPSVTSKKEILKTYNINIDVVEHGIDIKKEVALKLNKKKKYNVAFIGAIGIHKGSKILEKLIEYKKIKKIRFHLFGIIDSDKQKNNRVFVNHGRYKRNDLKKRLKENDIDLICLFSTCPETYSYTLTEAIACGIPVIAFDFGAISERIKKYNLGWTVKVTSTYIEIANKINEIFDNHEEYNKIINSINKYQIKTTKEMAKEYIDMYKNNLEIKEIEEEKIWANIKQMKNKIYNVSYNNYAWVFDTLKWKIISKIKIPKKIKKIINKGE